MPRLTRTLRTILPAAVLALAAVGPAPAAKPKVWTTNQPGQYDDARVRHAAVSSAGTLRLARLLRPLPGSEGLDATHVWALAEDKAGNLYAATGEEGKLLRFTPDGQMTVLANGVDVQVLCLAAAADGSVYAGTGPKGKVLHAAPTGEVRELCTLPAAYVWALAFDAAGERLLAGTGPKGRIYSVDRATGKAEVFYQTRQEHVLCLARGGDSLYAGTDRNGVVYSIDPAGKGYVVFQAPQAEVRCLLAAADGVYAGTAAPTRKRTPNGGSDKTASASGIGLRSGSSASGASAVDVSSSEEESSVSTSGGSGPARDKDADRPASSSSAPRPSSGENSVYFVGKDGAVRELFRDKALVLHLEKAGGKLLVATGMDGKLFEIDPATKERGEVARLDHGPIHCLLRRADGSVVVGCGDPAGLYLLQDKFRPSGTVVSEVFDAKLIAKWGALSWRADLPKGTSASFAVRGGNVSEPDETWTDWSAEQTDAAKASAAVPPARFLQYRVTLATTDAAVTPAVHAVSIRYATANQAPEVTALELPDPEVVANSKDPKRLRFKWSATDANEDDLVFNLYVRKDGWKEWLLLEEGYGKTDYEWDTTTAPTGTYQVKVVASDRPDNAEESALTGEKTAGPVVVSHEPPQVTIKVAGLDGNRATLEATATDPHARLVSASFALNGRKWSNVFPADGLFDSKSESFKFQTEELKPGTYVVVLKVKDAAGNVGTGDVVFTVKPAAGK